MFLDHTQRRSTVGRTPLDEWSARLLLYYLYFPIRLYEVWKDNFTFIFLLQLSIKCVNPVNWVKVTYFQIIWANFAQVGLE